jgi:hypothetical protein
MLKTSVEGESLLHRRLWRVVELQVSLSAERKVGSFYTDLVAMVFAFHTIEAYLNFVGERLAPDIWQDEQNFFRNEPYRGFNGKLRKVLELVELPWSKHAPRPLKTVLELKYLRDIIAHAKPEKFLDPITHPDGTEPPPIVPELDQLVTEQTRAMAIKDVEQFLNQVHDLASHKVNDIWFGSQALHGPSQHVARRTIKEL